MRVIAFLFATSLSALCFGVPAAHAIPESNYEADFDRLVRPFVRERGQAGSFQGQQGITIRYLLFAQPQARGAVVVSNGYTENYQKYAEVAFDLYQAGYSVFLFDHRGQGNSDRLLQNPNLGYIDRFQYLVDDLHSFVEQVVKPANRAGAPLLLLAHSMGGAVGARYLEQHPKQFAAAVLSAPMMGVQLGEWDPGVAKFLLRTLEFLGQGKSLALGTKQANPVNQPFEENELTHSPLRYRMARQAVRKNEGKIIEGATNSWVLRALLGGEDTLAGAAQAVAPLLVFQAEKDTFVSNPLEEEFCRKAPACELLKVPGANHEVLMELDSMREPALRRILEFFGAHASRR